MPRTSNTTTRVRFFRPLYRLLRAEAHAAIADAPTTTQLVVESGTVSAEFGDAVTGAAVNGSLAGLGNSSPERGGPTLSACGRSWYSDL